MFDIEINEETRVRIVADRDQVNTETVEENVRVELIDEDELEALFR